MAEFFTAWVSTGLKKFVPATKKFWKQYTVSRIENTSLYYFLLACLCSSSKSVTIQKISLARCPLVLTPHASSLSVQGLTSTPADRDPPSKTQTKPSHYTVGTAEAAAISAPSCCFSSVRAELHPSLQTCVQEHMKETRSRICASKLSLYRFVYVLYVENAKYSHILRVFPCCGGTAGIDQSCLIAAFNTPLSQRRGWGRGPVLITACCGRQREEVLRGRTGKWILWNSST